MLTLLAFIGFSTQVTAHGGATGVVKERMDQMSDMKKSIKIMAAMFRGKTPYQVQEVRSQALKIKAHSAVTLTDLFPEGSLTDSSEAKAEIWNEWDKFKALAEDLENISQALSEVADIRDSESALSNSTPSKSTNGVAMMGAAMMNPEMMSSEMSAVAIEPTKKSADGYFSQLIDTCAACHSTFRKEK